MHIIKESLLATGFRGSHHQTRKQQGSYHFSFILITKKGHVSAEVASISLAKL